MSNLRWDRGALLNRFHLAVFSALAVASSVHADAGAKLSTYDRGDGQTFYALSLTPPADTTAGGPSDVVMLFDTSASQTGVYRETALAALEACFARLGPTDRVQLLAVDLDARPLTNAFAAPGSVALETAVNKLRQESPLGSTDLELALRTAMARFDNSQDPASQDNTAARRRVVLYIGDGMSVANLFGTRAFGELVESLRTARVAVSSYAIGPRRDGALLAALANQTGGNLYVDEDMQFADDVEGVTADRATQENLRRGETIGELLADWSQATVTWPESTTLPAELGDAFPKQIPPLRSDRDTIIVGATGEQLAAPLSVEVDAHGYDGAAAKLHWTIEPQASDASYAYLAQVVETARDDDGMMLPTIGSAGLAETGRMLEVKLEQMTDLAQRAIATGDSSSANVMSQAVLRRDPGNVRAQTIQRIVNKPRTAATPVAEMTDAGNDLSLVRTAQREPAQSAGDEPFPAEGALSDRFDEHGALVEQVEEQKRVFAQMLRREVENVVVDARRLMADDPDLAAQQLKLALQNVDRAPELNADLQAQLADKLLLTLREVQRNAAIKDELDAAREEELAVARERQLLNERLARDIEKERQLIGRYNALMDERRFDEATEVAQIVAEIDPIGAPPRVALVSSELMRNDYLQQVNRATRWRAYWNTLYAVETSAIPFPDDPPIVYPDAPVWEELSNRRKKFASVDLKASGGAEERINEALASPLNDVGLQFEDEPLESVVNVLQTDYNIPIQVDVPALEDVGLSADEPVTINIQNVTLRSALRLMLRPHQLTYIIQDEVMIITTPDEAESRLVAKVYPVADLVLPIEPPQTAGGAGGIGGGQQGGGQGGGGGGFGGGGGGGFGGGGGGQGGGGGGLFSVPDDDVTSAAQTATMPAVAVDESRSSDADWNQYFAAEHDPAEVRQTARKLMGEKKYDEIIALIQAALRTGQPQPWMYESLGIAMELAGRSKAEIERVVMSAADFSTTPDELMYIATYLSRIGLDQRALQLCQQVVKLEPLRSEAYALGLHSAQRCNDLAGVQWATIGALGHAWPKEQAAFQDTARHVAQATLEQLQQEDRQEELEIYRNELNAALVRDCVVRVSWTGNADVDLEVEEPSGTVCSSAQPRTVAGGVLFNDEYQVPNDRRGGSKRSSYATGKSPVAAETYLCPQGFAGTYRVKIHRVWGDVTAGKVTVDVYRHAGSDQVEHERRQLDLGDDDAMVVFDLDVGRRTEAIEVAQLAGAVQQQQQFSRAVLAQQVDSLSDPRALPTQSDILRRRRALGAFGRGGAVGFQPIIEVLPEGTMLSVSGVVSADRRYVRIGVAPVFSTIGDVQTFTFAGSAEETDDQGGADGGMDGEVFIPPFNLGGGGFGGR